MIYQQCYYKDSLLFFFNQGLKFAKVNPEIIDLITRNNLHNEIEYK